MAKEKREERRKQKQKMKEEKRKQKQEKKEKQQRQKEERRKAKEKRRKKKRDERRERLPNVVLICVVIAVVIIGIGTLVAISGLCYVSPKAFDKKAEATLLASGLSIIGIAISVWAGLNIVNVLQKSEIESLVKSLRKTTSQIEKEQEEIEKKQKEIYFASFGQELLKTSGDPVSRYFYKEFDKDSFTMIEEYVDIIRIEQNFSQVYTQYGENATRSQLVLERAEEGKRLADELIKKRQGKEKNEQEDKRNILDTYLLCRREDFFFMQGYLEKGMKKVQEFLHAAAGYEKLCANFGVFLPQMGQYKESTLDGMNKDRLEIAAYFVNAIGESYSKVSEQKSLLGKCNEASGEVISEESMKGYSDKAIFYLNLATRWSGDLEKREVYYRNLGCAYERADRLSDHFGEHAEEILSNYKTAWKYVVSNIEEEESRVQKVYYTLLSYYERYMRSEFGYNSKEDTVFKDMMSFHSFLKSLENNKISKQTKEYLKEFQQTSEVAIADHARFSLQRNLNGMAWTWIVILLFVNDGDMKAEYPDKIERYLKKIREDIRAVEAMGINDDYYKELVKRYKVMSDYYKAYRVYLEGGQGMQYPSETIKAITEFLFIGKSSADLRPADLVIVLGNEFVEGTVLEIKALYEAGIIKNDAKIILSGATGTLNKGEELECERLYSYAVEKYHMPPELFLKECKATNTYLNFLYSKELIQQMGGFDSFSSILCIGKAFILRRASMYAAKLEYPIEKMQYYGTVDKQGKNIGADCWWESETATERVMAEIKRIGEYFEKGDLSIF